MEQIEKKNIVEAFEESDAYTILINPIKDEIDSLKHAYEVEGKEAARLKGYVAGLYYILDYIEMCKTEGDAMKARIVREDIPEENKVI